MHLRRSALRPAGLCLALVAVSGGAEAAEPAAVHLRIDAPRDCATEATFWNALSRRTDRLTRATASEGAATIDVAITRSNAMAEGELRIVRAGKASERRRMAAASCAEVADGLSLVAALAFDPAAKLASVGGATTITAASSDAPTVASTTATRGDVTREGVDPDRAPSRSSPPSTPRLRDPRRWTLAVGANGGGVVVGEPGATVTLGGFAEVSHERSGLAPSFRAGAVRTEATAAAAAAPHVRADLSWTLARVSVCALRVDLAPGLSARPCVGAEGGVFAASTGDVTTARDRSRLWLAPSLAARLGYAPISPVFVELQAAIAAPLVRDDIVVDPSLFVYRAPVLMPSGEVAAGVRFP